MFNFTCSAPSQIVVAQPLQDVSLPRGFRRTCGGSPRVALSGRLEPDISIAGAKFGHRAGIVGDRCEATKDLAGSVAPLLAQCREVGISRGEAVVYGQLEVAGHITG